MCECVNVSECVDAGAMCYVVSVLRWVCVLRVCLCESRARSRESTHACTVEAVVEEEINGARLRRALQASRWSSRNKEG